MTPTKSSPWREHLLGGVDAAWLAAFRGLFGLSLAVSMWRFLANGWVERFFVEPKFMFKFWGLPAVTPLPGPALQSLVVTLAILALGVAFGFAFRVTSVLLALGLTYLQLLDVTNYLNHYYLASLLCGLLAVSPAARAWSIDAWFQRRWLGRSTQPTQVARAWHWLFRFQIGLVYVFAALAKAQPDWLLHAQPLRIWLGASVDLPILGRLLQVNGVPLVMSWCGFLFDATIVGWLSWRVTRPYAYAVVLVFHALTRLLFPIGMFPVIMSVSALVFFDASWPRRLLSRLSGSDRAPFATTTPEAGSAIAVGRRWHSVGLALGALYCAAQVLLPLRFLAYGGNVLWHEQGMRFSWRVMVRAKGGDVTFLVTSKRTGKTWHVSPAEHLTPLQEAEMVTQPDLILQLAHHVRDDAEARGLGPVEVHVDARASLNGRPSARLIDPRIDLASIQDGLARQDWILDAPQSAPPHTRIVL